MRDRIVSTIATITAMLEETTHAKEEAEQAVMDAVDLSARLARELETARQDLQGMEDNYNFAHRQCNELREDLARESAKHRDNYVLQGRGRLGLLAICQPDRFAKAMAYMGGPDGLVDMNAKIVQIKRVREATQWGLKEAKDFVEAFYECGVWYVAPPTPELPTNVANAE